MSNIRSTRAALRHSLAAEFRRDTYKQLDIVLFPHQSEWQLATEGWTLTEQAPKKGDQFTLVRLPDESIESRLIVPRGCIAHVAADLAAYKAGKSWSASAWLTGYASPKLPDAKVVLVGLEQINAAPEFNYICEFLLSEEGLNLKYETLRNDAREGKMWLRLDTGNFFEVRSYKKREGMKGDTVDVYLFAEAYMLPGLQCYTSIAQNLRQRGGHALFPSTPDSAWVDVLHKKGHPILIDRHGRPYENKQFDPRWHCTCDVDASCNPHTYDQAARDQDDPDKGGLMTRERFRIHWGGKVGQHIGQVFDYDQASQMCTPGSHPFLWTPEAVEAFNEGLHL